MLIKRTILKKLFKFFLALVVIIPTVLSAEDVKETRKTKEYPLKPKYTFTGDKEAHCELWSLDRVFGKAATCRRKAKKPSSGPILCRFKRSYINEDDATLTMCVYEKAGYKMEEFTISSETYVCQKEFKCKR